MDEIRKELDNFLNNRYEDEEKRENFIRDVSREVISKRNLNVTNFNKIFSEPYVVNNRMTQCKLTLPNNQNFPLDVICNSHPLIFQARVPSLTLFIEDSPCTALFSRTGSIIITGGKSLRQIINAIIIFCGRVIDCMNNISKGLGDSITISSITVRNNFSSNKLVLGSIRIPSLVDKLRSNGFLVIYEPDKLNVPKWYPLQGVNNSVVATVFANGGVNIMGWKYAYELQYAALICETMIHDQIVYKQEYNLESILEYNQKRKEAVFTQYLLSRDRKKKKIELWKQRKIEKKNQTPRY